MEMFRFANNEYLYALAIIPMLLLVFVLTRLHRRRALAKFGQKEIVDQLMPNVSKNRPFIKFFV